jgi:thiol-disulfide isomerase/thioredoxin
LRIAIFVKLFKKYHRGMKKILYSFLITSLFFLSVKAQTPLTTAVDFDIKILDGTVIELFPLLDQNKIVVLDFFSTSCGPCQTFAYDFQLAYEAFGSNDGNVVFLGINFNGTNEDVRFFDSLFNITVPTASGLDGGGNKVFNAYQVAAYPTVVVIKPDHTISSQYVWEPSFANIRDAVISAGGLFVGQNENGIGETAFSLFPNPSSFESVLEFELESPSLVSINIRDLSGRLISVQLSDTFLQRGFHQKKINSESLISGMYLVELSVDKRTTIKKLIVRD